MAVHSLDRRSGAPLSLLVDSSGIKFMGAGGGWQARKHEHKGRRQCHIVHLAMDTATSNIRAVGIIPSPVGDSPILPDLLGQILEEEQIGTGTADGAYDPGLRPVGVEAGHRPVSRTPNGWG